MQQNLNPNDIATVQKGFHPEPSKSFSLHRSAYVEPRWFELEKQSIFVRSWQWVCHVEKLREPGCYVTAVIADNPIFVTRDREGTLQAFYNVCKHRAHELLQGEGRKSIISCPYHAWAYNLRGQLIKAPHTESLEDFDTSSIRLDAVQVEDFCGFVYVNLNPQAPSLSTLTGALGGEISKWAPDIESLTFSHRLTYDIRSNWKNVVDNFLECYHCPTAHRDFCTLVDMDTYKVTTHEIYSSHMAEAGKTTNSAYDVVDATVKDHAVWWLWPNTCLMRYPGRGNFIVMQIVPVDHERTFETYDFYFESSEPNEGEREAIRYIDEVLQAEDIALVESVQRGMNTPAFTQGTNRSRSKRFGQIRARGAPLSWADTRRLPPGNRMRKRPNVVIVMADQLAPQFTTTYGHPLVRTPHLDSLAAKGTRFDSAYCNSPLCAPSRFSFMAGQLVTRIAAYDNAAEFPATIPTFAHYLRQVGYRTCLSGKMHFVGPDQLHGFEERLTTDIYPR